MDEKTQKIYDQTLRFLSFRPRAVSEAEVFLRKHHANQKQIDNIINKLKNLELLNDEAFTKWWVEERQTFKPKGLRFIKSELRFKRISQDLIEKVLGNKKEQQVLEMDLAQKAALKKLPHYKNLSRNDLSIKIGRYLVSCGFDWEVAKTVIDEIINKE